VPHAFRSVGWIHGSTHGETERALIDALGFIAISLPLAAFTNQTHMPTHSGCRTSSVEITKWDFFFVGKRSNPGVAHYADPAWREGENVTLYPTPEKHGIEVAILAVDIIRDLKEAQPEKDPCSVGDVCE